MATTVTTATIKTAVAKAGMGKSLGVAASGATEVIGGATTWGAASKAVAGIGAMAVGGIAGSGTAMLLIGGVGTVAVLHLMTNVTTAFMRNDETG
ncbi:hypothetical protein [Magnetospira sp. QH-2]|uniref:hypothetical protein n=1 Tax=Magnetospira sp. (strain QH-2) TaxID=1288970 RepID=UPI0003E81B46|nr:hypothetical protein [Magnetospira sp. QH-2]CCQ75592.1 protein of unknown function [Magnetospira sp. QH-2]